MVSRNNIYFQDENSPLHLAAANGNTKTVNTIYFDIYDIVYLLQVETLIDKFGASIRARTKDGNTLLHIAAEHGQAQTGQ